MDVESLAKQLILQKMTQEQQDAVLQSIKKSVAKSREIQKQKIGENVGVVVEAFKKIESDIRERHEILNDVIEKRVASINAQPGNNGKDGRAGRDGKNGKDGRNGIDGQPGPAGADGEDGVSVVDAKIDFDGSLVIGLSSGREINVGEVVAADLAEKIKVTMSTNSTVAVQDEGTTITSGVRSLNFTGTGVTATASGDSVTVNVTGGGGGGSVISVTGTSPVVSSGGTTPDISLAASYGDTQNPYASKTANNFLAAPNGTAGVPTFRAVAAADIPTLNQNTTGTAANVTGIVAVANGGSGTATPSIVAGTNVTVTGTWPNQTIAASGGGSGTITISNKTADYLVDASDLGAIINFTSGPFTAYLTAAATLGSGFNVTIWNTSTSSITIDPDGTETIDGGQTTIILRRYEGTQLVCNGTGWNTGSKKKMQGYAENYPSSEILPSAFGLRSLAIGINSTATGARAISVGNGEIATTASGAKAFAFCGTAGAVNSVAFGMNSASVGAVTGSTGVGAISLNGSYASGTDSFSAAVVNNTSTYGATGANTIVFGYLAKASATYALAIGGDTNESSGSYSVTIGGSTNLASGSFSYAAGYFAVSTQYGKKAYSSGRFSTNNGSAQLGTMVLRKPTTDATASVLTTDEGTAASTNQVILPNNSAFSFTGTIIARQQAAGGSNYAAWEIKGAIIRDANAASTTLGSFNINALSATAGASAWVVALTADTTNGGLAITVTGAAATNIRWVATVNTSEVTYA